MAWIYASAIAVAALLVLADVCFRRYSTNRISEYFENTPPFGVVPGEPIPGVQTLRIPTADNCTLSAGLHLPSEGSPRGLVVFCPELNGNHWMAAHYCAGLLARRVAVLAFDFRNQGSSDIVPDYKPIHWVTHRELEDVEAVLEYIQNDSLLSVLPLGIFGVSRGGTAALIAGCRYPRIRGVVADSAFGTMLMVRHFVNRFVRLVVPQWVYNALPEWHIRMTLKQAMRKSERRRNCRYIHLEDEVHDREQPPMLLISGSKDSYVSRPVAKGLCELLGRSASLWTVNGAKHNMARHTDQDAYDQRTADHLLEALGLSSPNTAAADSADTQRSASLQSD